MNILYATTTSWNIGDDLIRLGCERMMNEIFGEHNKVLFNKHPQIRLDTNEPQTPCDNSYKDCMTDFNLDVIVMAGTPENFTSKCDAFYDLCEKNNAKKIFLGLGGPPKFMNAKAKDVLHKADFVSVRDASIKDELQSKIGREVHSFPCTAFYAFNEASIPEKKIVFVPRPTKKINKIHGLRDDDFELQSKILENIIKEFPDYEIQIVCHYVDEFYHYSDKNVRYSYDLKDYVKFYQGAEVVISSRIHGCALAASMGIKTIGFAEDFRAGTMHGFKTKILNYGDDVISAMRKLETNEILAHKKRTYEEYISAIKGAL